MSEQAPLRVDVDRNRAARKYRRGTQVARVAWALARPAFAFSPRILWGWRRWLLRRFGARVGRGVHVCPGVRIAMPWNLAIGDDAAVGDRAILYALGPIRIGARCTVSQGAHLCAGSHDWRRADMALLKPPVTIEEDVWICAEAFVGPGVVVGRGAIVAARAVVMRRVPAGMIAAGNPATVRPKPAGEESEAP